MPEQPPAGGAARTTALGTDVALAEPSLFVAVTRIRIVLPTSGRLSTYVLWFAPPIAEQLPPLASQRRQEYVYVIGSVPLHVPLPAVSVCPS